MGKSAGGYKQKEPPMLIELTAIFMGKEIPLLLNPQHIVSIAKPTVGRRTEGWKLPEGPWTYIDMTTGAYHLVKGSYEQVRDKWEKALGEGCECPAPGANEPYPWHGNTHGSWDNCGVPGKGDPVWMLRGEGWHHKDCPAYGALCGHLVECTCTHLRHDPDNEPS